MAFCVMIRDVGEDPLSPALRDIERERRAKTALDTRCYAFFVWYVGVEAKR